MAGDRYLNQIEAHFANSKMKCITQKPFSEGLPRIV
jgi:hypothetical protein